MADRINHAELAGNAIGKALVLAEDEEATSITHAMVANARATLALVEQQRIANLIALATFAGTNPDALVLPIERAAWLAIADAETGEPLAAIREGLGL